MAWSDYHTSVSTAVTIRGTTYPSIWRAAKALGCHPNNIRKAHKEGWLDRAGIKTQERKNDVDRTSNHTQR
jgi:DNA-binding transcriptional regulator YhcF (GntR family)